MADEVEFLEELPVLDGFLALLHVCGDALEDHLRVDLRDEVLLRPLPQLDQLLQVEVLTNLDSDIIDFNKLHQIFL